MAAGTWRSANKAPVDCNHSTDFARHPATIRVSVEILTIVYTRRRKQLKFSKVQTSKRFYCTNLHREYTILIFFSSSQIVHQSLMPEESRPILERDDGCVAKNRKDETKMFHRWSWFVESANRIIKSFRKCDSLKTMELIVVRSMYNNSMLKTYRTLDQVK